MFYFIRNPYLNHKVNTRAVMRLRRLRRAGAGSRNMRLRRLRRTTESINERGLPIYSANRPDNETSVESVSIPVIAFNYILNSTF